MRREQVAPHVDGEDVSEAAHACLRRQVEHAVDTVEIEVALREIDAPHVELPRVLLLLSWVVVIGEAVDADDVVARRGERLGEIRADESGGACDDVPHRGTIP
jgi:hypothetical protein